MKSERIMIIDGCLMAFEDQIEYDGDLRAAGVSKEMFRVLTLPRRWRAGQVDVARRALDGVITCAFAVAGIPRYTLMAEYLAAAVSKVVHPCNWPVAAYMTGGGLDGTRLVAVSRGETVARESIPPEEMFALVTLAAQRDPVTMYALENEREDPFKENDDEER